MADSIEIRLDQLTDAIKGLYAKSSMSQGEIYNALTSLSQRYENLTNVSSEKIAQTLVNEFRKTIDVKYGQTNQFIKDLENSLRNFAANSSNQSPRLAAEISKLLTDTANTYAKLNSQDALLQKIFLTIEKSSKENGSNAEIIKLSENFANFSRGFENITLTLNKNFAEFLTQVRQNSSKKEYDNLKNDLNAISTNVNSVVSTISLIDSKYRDLGALIDSINQKEDLFNSALREVKQLCNTIVQAKSTQDPTIAIQTLSNTLKNQIESVKYEIQKIATSPKGDLQLKTDINSLVNNVQGVHTNLQNINLTIGSLSNEIKDIHDSIGQQTSKNQSEIENFLSIAKDDMRNLLASLSTFRQSIDEINTGSVRIIQEPLERALNELKSQDLSRNIQDLAGSMRGISIDIQNSIQNIQMNLNTINTNPAFQILNQISEMIPSIASKLEVFKTQITTESTNNINQLKNSLFASLNTFKEDLSAAVERIEVDARSINIDSIDMLKIDLQKLSDHIVDSVDSLNEKTIREFDNLKTDFDEFANKQTDTVDKLSEKLASVEICVENLSQDTIYKLNDRIEAANTQNQEAISEIKADILENISNIDKSNKESLNSFEAKIDKILDDFSNQNTQNNEERESLKNAFSNIENKIECTNLQQIHNAKELMEEIQSSNNSIANKLSAIEQNNNTSDLSDDVSRILQKLKDIEATNIDLNEDLKETKDQIESKLKENIQKIAALVEQKEQDKNTNTINTDFDEFANKIQEYLSNLEYLKGNISQEVRESIVSELNKLSFANDIEELKKSLENEFNKVTIANDIEKLKKNIEGEFSKLQSSIKKIKSSDENSNYSYTLEDVESDLAKMRISIEKNALNSDDFKNLFEKIVELRTVGLENIKISRDTETELGNVSGLFKDTNNKLDEIIEKINEIQNTGFEDIKTRLLQSEKSKTAAAETSAKIENTLRVLIKNVQNQDTKIIELTKKADLISQAQQDSFNPAQFIDIFYENMTQTKMLSNRVEIMEDKINSIQSAVERLISYVEQ